MKALVQYFRNRRIRRAREWAAYWKAKADMGQRLCAGRHMSYERSELVVALANQKRYEARLESLLSNGKTQAGGTIKVTLPVADRPSEPVAPLGLACPACGGTLVHSTIPCPDGRVGCLVVHHGLRCVQCGKYRGRSR